MDTRKNRWKGTHLVGEQDGLTAGLLARLAGRMPKSTARPAQRDWIAPEALEARILLDGDHPELPTPFNPAVGTVVTIDAMTGQGTANGTISAAMGGNPDDDLFRFTVTTTDFVTVLANTAGLTSNLNNAINVYDSTGALIAQGTNNGRLTSVAPLPARDAWVGFIATPGDYYVQVFGESATTGDYQLRVDTTTTDLATPIPLPDDPPPVEVGEFTVDGNVAILQGETVYFLDVPDDAEFDSLATLVASADPTELDTRLEVYNASGALVASDSDTSWLTSAYVAWKSNPGERFYVRVRSDDLATTNQSTGDFTLLFDLAAYELANPMSEVTRRGSDEDHAIASPVDTDVYTFQAQGTGLTFVTVIDFTSEGGFAVHLYDEEGTQVAFDDDFVGTTPQIEVDLIGGTRYFVVVQSFEPPPLPIFPPAAYGLYIEAHHTTDETVGVDDHEDTPPNGTPLDVARRQFDRATPLQWNDPRLINDSYGNPAFDHSWVTDAVATGRIHNATDTDLYTFTAPMNMLGSYPGDNDDAGTALYVGGAFDTADPDAVFPVNSAGLSIWDAGDWWFAGSQGTEDNPLGFLNNEDTPGTDGPEIYALHSFTAPNSSGQPILIVGGDFTLQISPNLSVNNLAAWVFNPNAGVYQWFLIGNLGTVGAVRAITEYDPVEFDENGDEEGGEIADPGNNRLFIGGDFTALIDPTDPFAVPIPSNHIAAFELAPVPFDLTTFPVPSLVGGWAVDAVGTDGPIHAFAVYDPEDPGERREMTDDLTEVADTPDPPLTLFIGGDFSDAGGVATDNLATWNGVEFGTVNYGTPNVDGNIDGPVHVLQVWDPPDPEEGEGSLGQPVLVIGGEFDNAGDVAAANIVVYGRVANPADGDPASDPEVEDYQPRLLFEDIGGTNGAVHAVVTITHIDPDGAENGEDIIVGGAFTQVDGDDALHIAVFDDTQGWFQPFGDGFDDTVFTLAVVTDLQEPGVADDVQTLYAGGAFLNSGMTAINRAARWDAANGEWVGLNTGTSGPVFVMADYDDGNPNEWDRNDRPSSKMVITVSPNFGSFLNAFVRVFDSNLNLIYANDTKSPFPDPAGSVDPSIAPGANDILVIPEIWAGETYYIEVSSATQGYRNTGRYSLTVTVDAVPVDVDEDGALDDPISTYREEPDAGQWAGAQRINVDAGPGDQGEGDGSNRVNVESQGGITQGPPVIPASGNITRRYNFPRTPTDPIGATPSRFLNTEGTDYGSIESIDDTDLFFFRASASGYVEIRLNTTNIQQFFFQRLWDFNNFPLTAEETLVPDDGAHVMSSRLQSMIRVFDNDQTQIGVSGYNPAVSGEGDLTTTGRFGDRTYTHRDARIVIPVEANRVYFVQVESGQFPIFQQNPDLVDWRFATGAYELLIDSVPDFTPDNADDVANITNRASPFPIGIDPADPTTNGRGSVNGVIRDVLNNPDEPNDDRDLYFYYATGDGPVALTARAFNSNVSLSITVTNNTGGTVATGLAAPGGEVNINFVGEQGQRFYIQVDGAGGTQGAYQLDIVGVPYADDHADIGSWINATTLSVNAFLGTAVATGRIEAAGDSDIFVFTSDQWSLATVTVESLSVNTLDPFVRVYEIQEDLAGNQYFAQIVFNDDTPLGPVGNRNAFGRFSVSPGRDYYVVVDGFDPNLDFGDYQLTVRVAPTDDHPNQANFPLSTALNPTVNSSGFAVASITGRIEVEADDDVFRFIAPAGGSATITFTRNTGDLDPLIRVLNSAGVEITGSPVGDTTPGVVTFSFNVLRSQTYYIVVDLDVDAGTGTYTLDLQTPANDDHANAGEFTIASAVNISSTTGIGTLTGVLNPSVDSDLFRFSARVVGNATITVSTPASTFNPRIQVFDANFVLIPGASDDAESATQVIAASAINQVFYILVLSDTVGGGTPTGSYEVRVQQTIGGGGGPGPGPGTDDHANAGNFGNASPITLDARTGDGSISGIINTIGDTDLFRFTTPALTSGQSGNRPVFIQVINPAGGLVDGIVRIFRENSVTPGQFDLVAADSNGTPGNTASLRFDAPGNTTYYVLVEPVGSSTGSYTLRVDTEPNTHFLYYPEGYTADTIDEFVPVVNPNNFAVTYSVIARYEVGDRDQVIISNAVIPANSRGGFTVASRNNGSLTRRDTPYALEIQANGQLGATFAHYDFGVTTGENFTNRTSTTWTFAQVNRDGIANPATLGNLFNDFVVFYNPNNADVTVNITLVYDNGATTTFARTIGALRRSGISFDTDDAVTLNGRFSVRLASSAPIVAAMSSYDIQNGRGFGLLGDADAGATTGVVPNISTGNGVEAAVALYNATNSAATVTITASYTQTNLPDVVRTVSLAANTRLTRTLTELGVVAGQPVGIRYTSNAPVTFNAIEYKNGDGDATTAATYAGTTAIFGDAFVTPGGAGNTYIEQIGLYNPSASSTTVAIRFLFTDGTVSAPVNVTVGARRFSLFQVDQAAAVLNGPTPAFSIRLDSATPFVASFTHYDLFLGGGWSTTGALIGLTNALSTIS